MQIRLSETPSFADASRPKPFAASNLYPVPGTRLKNQNPLYSIYETVFGTVFRPACRWPQTLIAWTRLLAGRLRDPLVGRDILVGGLFGISFQLLDQLQYLAQGWLGPYPPILQGIGLETLLGGRFHCCLSYIINKCFLAFRGQHSKRTYSLPS